MPPGSLREVWFGARASTDLRCSILAALESWGAEPKLINAAVCHDSFTIEGKSISESQAAEQWQPDVTAPTFEDIEDIAQQVHQSVGETARRAFLQTLKAVQEQKRQSSADDS